MVVSIASLLRSSLSIPNDFPPFFSTAYMYISAPDPFNFHLNYDTLLNRAWVVSVFNVACVQGIWGCSPLNSTRKIKFYLHCINQVQTHASVHIHVTYSNLAVLFQCLQHSHPWLHLILRRSRQEEHTTLCVNLKHVRLYSPANANTNYWWFGKASMADCMH